VLIISWHSLCVINIFCNRIEGGGEYGGVLFRALTSKIIAAKIFCRNYLLAYFCGAIFNVALLLIVTMKTPLKRDPYHLHLVNFAKPQ